MAARRHRSPRCSARSHAGTGSCSRSCGTSCPVPDDGRPFEERMTLRLASQAPINDPREPLAAVSQGRAPRASERRGRRGQPLRRRHGTSCRCAAGTRSRCSTSRSARPEQLERKGRALGERGREVLRVARRWWRGPARRTTRSRYRDSAGGRSAEVFDELRGTRLTRERRSRPASSSRTRGSATRCARSPPGEPLSFPRPTAAEDAAFAVDAAVLGEADLIRVRRRLDELEHRVAALEARTGARLERRLRALARRVRGGT